MSERGGLVTDVRCPRCRKPAAYLIPPYWDSPYFEQGGLCPDCVQLAYERFEEVGWPDMPADKDWERFPENCPCDGDEFCGDCDGSGVRMTK